MEFVTDFADEGVVLPLFAAVAVVLLALRRSRLALAWTLAAGFVMGVTLLLKLGGYAVADLGPSLPPAQIGLVTPSGHVAVAATAYGGLAAMIGGRAQTARRRAVVVALVVALVVGWTRVLLGEHSLAEAVVGSAVGVTGAALFASLARGAVGGAPTRPVLGIAVMVVVILHGTHFTLESQIRATSADAVREWLRGKNASAPDREGPARRRLGASGGGPGDRHADGGQRPEQEADLAG